MKRIFCVSGIILLSVISCLAQTIKQTDFEKLVDYVNCRYAKAYMGKAAATPSDKLAYDTRILPVLKNSSLEKHLSFDELYKLLEGNSWGETANKLVKLRKENKKLTDVAPSTDSNIVKYIVEISGNFKTIIGNEEISNIESELLKKYEVATPTHTPAPVSNTVVSSPTTGNNNDLFHWLMWGIVGTEALLLFAISYFLWKCWNKLQSVELVKNSISSVYKNNTNNSDGIKMFEDKVNSLERRLGNMQEQLDRIQQTSKVDDSPSAVEHNAELNNGNNDIKYFRTKLGKVLQDEMPNGGDASFKVLETESKFEYIGGVVNPDLFAGICDFANNPNDIPNKKRIITVVQGTVIKENNHWVIDKPAIIKFE